MKFRLRDGHGQSAVREIGAHLRIHGSGHHWIEKFRGEIYLHPGSPADEKILREEFAGMLEAVRETDERR